MDKEVSMEGYQERDSKGRFLGMRYPEIEAQIAADNEWAKKIVKVCDALEIKPEAFGLKQYENGNWSIDYLRAKSMLLGITLGLACALNKPPEETHNLLLIVSDAAGISLL